MKPFLKKKSHKRNISVIQIHLSIRITVLVKNKNRENGKIDKTPAERYWLSASTGK